jgi:hypothetical protein
LLALELRTSLVLKSLLITGETHSASIIGTPTKRRVQREVGYLEVGESTVKWKCLEVRWSDIEQNSAQKRSELPVSKDLGWCAPVQGMLPWNQDAARYSYDGVLALADALRCNNTLQRLRVEKSSLGGKHGERAIRAIARSLCQMQIGVDEYEIEGGMEADKAQEEDAGPGAEGLVYGGLVRETWHCGGALVELGLAGNGLDSECVVILAHMLVRNSMLHSLDISHNSCIGRESEATTVASMVSTEGDTGAAVSTPALDNDTDHPTKPSCLKILFEALSRPSIGQRITSLNLAHCYIGDDGIKSMINGCVGSVGYALTALNLSNNRIQREGAAMLSRSLSGAGAGTKSDAEERVGIIGAHLTDLNVSGNDMDAEGVLELCEAITRNCMLTSVNLARMCKPQAIHSDDVTPSNSGIAGYTLPPLDVAVAVRQVFQQNSIIQRIYLV